MTITRTEDAALIRDTCIAAADRPWMLADGAEPMAYKPDMSLLYLAGWVGGIIAAVFVGTPVTSICMDFHCCILPAFRGRTAVALIRALFQWIRDNTGLRKVIGHVPEWNLPSLLICRAVGMRRIGVISGAILKAGVPRSIVLVGVDL